MELAQKYIDDVMAGRIALGRRAAAAVYRHVKDLEKQNDPKYPYFFDVAAATRVIEFVKICRHTKGKWMGKLFQLQPWQSFIIAAMFGWKKKRPTHGVSIGLTLGWPERMGKRNWWPHWRCMD